MNAFSKIAKTTIIFMASGLLLVATTFQPVSAAMVQTETLVQASSPTQNRDRLHHLAVREQLRQALVARGLDPQEAATRIASLTGEEIAQIAANLDTLRAGRGVFIFSMIIVGVIVATVIVFNFTNVTDVFP